MSKYNEIMEHLHVDEALRGRVLRGAEQALSARRRRLLRRAAAIAACAAVLLGGVLMMPRLLPDPGGQVQIVSPIQEYTSAQSLSDAVGFAVADVPSLAERAQRTDYLAYSGTLAEIRYELDGQRIAYRKSAGTQDNSGCYEAFPRQTEAEAAGCPVTLQGDDTGYRLAFWTDGVHAYSLLCDAPTDAATLTALAQEILQSN
ncbi:MAG: hypothetical protein ACI4XW_09175 [Candidatus Spyradocola sp.]